MLNDRSRNTDRIHFLESIIPDEMFRHLAGDNNHRNRIHIGGGNTSNRIGCTRTRSDQHHARFTCRSGITIGGMRCPLFMTNKYMLHIILLIKSIVNMQYGTTWVTKYIINAFCFQAFNNNFCAG